MNLTAHKVMIYACTTLVLLIGNTSLEAKRMSDMTIAGTQYRSIVETVTAASNLHNPESIATDKEHFGAILRRVDQEGHAGASYFYTHGVASRKDGSFRFRLALTKGDVLVAIWHTHGGRHPRNRYFSRSDIDTATTLNVPIYLADFMGILRVYDPAKPPGKGSRRRSAYSNKVDKIASRGTIVRDEQDNELRVSVLASD